MHIHGVSSAEAKKKITELSDGIRRVYENTSDTLFIITADHGQIDITDTIYIYEDAELMDTLQLYPYLEPRAVAFRVKPGRHKDLERLFTARYGEDFALFPSGYLIENGLFGGKGEKCRMLGDYIAIGTFTHKIIRAAPTAKRYKGHHTSLTEEMEIPLIILRN